MTSWETIGEAASICGIMIALDIIAGMISAASRGELRSRELRQGLFHKAASMIIIALAIALEQACGILDLGISMPIVIPTTAYIVIMEACSIYENAKTIDPDLHIKSIEDLFDFTHNATEGSGTKANMSDKIT